MIFFDRIRPKLALEELQMVLIIGVVTATLFGQFIDIRSRHQLFLASSQPVAQTAVATNSSNTAEVKEVPLLKRAI
ncbi:MAG: hypothetical protein ACLVJN_05460 [Streptococcus parasanguinis]